MPLDPSFVPALEEELWMAKQVKPGGQPPREDRIDAIKEQIALHSQGKVAEDPAPENASDAPTDYESHDADVGAEKVKSARKKAKADVETSVATSVAEETTDA